MAKINRWFLGFFLVVMWPLVPMLGAEEPSSEVFPAEKVVPAGEAVPPVSAETTPGIDNAVQKAQQEVRDPFAMAPEAPAPASEDVSPAVSEIKVELQGIGSGSNGDYAVIGDEIFYKGVEKKGIKLLEVRRGEVDILVNGGRITVPLFAEQDLRRAKDRAQKKNAIKDSSMDRKPETPLS